VLEPQRFFTSIFRGESIAHCTFANNRPGQWLSRDLGGSLCSQAAHFTSRPPMAQIPDTIRRLSSSDGGVLLDLRRGMMFRVNPLGARVLDLLEQGDSPEQIAEKFSAEFQVPLEEVQADVREFVDALKVRCGLDASC